MSVETTDPGHHFFSSWLAKILFGKVSMIAGVTAEEAVTGCVARSIGFVSVPRHADVDPALQALKDHMRIAKVDIDRLSGIVTERHVNAAPAPKSGRPFLDPVSETKAAIRAFEATGYRSEDAAAENAKEYQRAKHLAIVTAGVDTQTSGTTVSIQDWLPKSKRCPHIGIDELRARVAKLEAAKKPRYRAGTDGDGHAYSKMASACRSRKSWPIFGKVPVVRESAYDLHLRMMADLDNVAFLPAISRAVTHKTIIRRVTKGVL